MHSVVLIHLIQTYYRKLTTKSPIWPTAVSVENISYDMQSIMQFLLLHGWVNWSTKSCTKSVGFKISKNQLNEKQRNKVISIKKKRWHCYILPFIRNKPYITNIMFIREYLLAHQICCIDVCTKANETIGHGNIPMIYCNMKRGKLGNKKPGNVDVKSVITLLQFRLCQDINTSMGPIFTQYSTYLSAKQNSWMILNKTHYCHESFKTTLHFSSVTLTLPLCSGRLIKLSLPE